MIKLGFRLVIILLFLYVLSQFPGIIEVFVLLFQVVGGTIVRLIEHQPLFFAVGFLFIYGLGNAKSQ